MKFGFFILLAIILLGGLFYFFSPKPQVVNQSSTNTAITPTAVPVTDKQISLVIKNNALVSGNEVITLTEGENVTITVITDADDELHLHGYDKEIELGKDVPTKVSFTADLTGRFPIELHNTETEIAVLEVQPN